MVRYFADLYDRSEEDPGSDSDEDAVVFAHWTRFAFDDCTPGNSFSTGLHQQRQQIKVNI